MSSRSNPGGLNQNPDSTLEAANGVAPKRGMVLPFTPLAMSFDEVNYYVDMPPVSNSTNRTYLLTKADFFHLLILNLFV